jgi:hypothetical protein
VAAIFLSAVVSDVDMVDGISGQETKRAYNRRMSNTMNLALAEQCNLQSHIIFGAPKW